MKVQFNTPPVILRLLLLFILWFSLSLLLRIPATSEIEPTRFFSMLVPSFLAFSLSAFMWKFSRAFFYSYFFFLCLYLPIPYFKLSEHILLLPGEIVGAFCVGTFSFSLIWYLYFLYRSLRNTFMRLFSLFLFLLDSFIAFLVPLIFIIYYFINGQLLTADILLAVFQTNPEEALSYLYMNGIIPWVIGILAFFILLYAFIRFIKAQPFSQSKLRHLVLYSISFILIGVYFAPRSTVFYPFNITRSSIQVLHTFKDYGLAKEQRQAHLASLPNLFIEPKAGGVHVLVIGESETRDHMHVYGYSRNTTPWLDSFSTENGSILFSHAYSNHTHTVPVLTYALTAKNQYNHISLADAFSIMEAAKAAGYETWWISNQQKYGAFDTPTAEIASIADHELWLNKNLGNQVASWQYDAAIIPHLSSLQLQGNAFIVIHLMGSHFGYSDRYPKEFTQFSGNIHAIDTYDNSIFYTDFVLKQIYESFASNPDFRSFIYFSDHGEAPTSGGHESTKFAWPMSHIPLIMHFSPQFQEKQSAIYSTLAMNKDKCWTNDLLYEAMLSILGIQGIPDHNGSFDLASPQYAMTPQNLYTLHGQKQLSEDPSLS